MKKLSLIATALLAVVLTGCWSTPKAGEIGVVRNGGPFERSRRFSGERLEAEDVALGLARGSGEMGAMSVCVVDPLGKVVWAAGEGFEQFNQAKVEDRSPSTAGSSRSRSTAA